MLKLSELLNKVTLSDTIKLMQGLPPKSVDVLYTDPPYNMNSRYYIDPNTGHYHFLKGKGSDFESAWEAMDGYWWHNWFKEAYRVLKDNGYMLLHNIDRQSDMWSYYGRRVGLLPLQKLYWLFIDNFPQGADVALQIDNDLGVERNVIGIKGDGESSSYQSHQVYGNRKANFKITEATSELAKKYDGYKYGMIALKQIMEEVLVFQKLVEEPIINSVKIYESYRRGDISFLHTPMHLPILNIKATMVRPTRFSKTEKERWTPQLLLQDNQQIYKNIIESTRNHTEALKLVNVLPRIGYTQEDLIPYLFEPKITKKEKEAGLNGEKNPHPTPKPIRLCMWILTLFKPPDPIVVYDAFAGQGSIPCACKKLGIDYIASELNPEFLKTAELKLQNVSREIFQMKEEEEVNDATVNQQSLF